jgi:enoyl-CoA hydratase/carnithine racemase
MPDTIVTESADRIARIQINRPEKKNALTADMYQRLADALRGAAADSRIRVVFIHGQADCFCSGNDLKDFLERPPHADNAPVFQFLQAISTAPKPVVAAVSGVAVGIGTTMLLHCDLVFATAQTRFQLPFVPLGIVPEAGSSLLLPMMAGYQRAAELLLLGRPFGAEKAREIGFVNEIVAPEALMTHASEAAQALAALPPESVRLTKALMRKRNAPAVAQQMDEEGRTFRARLDSPEAKEAMTAFFEKRKPDFSRF